MIRNWEQPYRSFEEFARAYNPSLLDGQPTYAPVENPLRTCTECEQPIVGKRTYRIKKKPDSQSCYKCYRKSRNYKKRQGKADKLVFDYLKNNGGWVRELTVAKKVNRARSTVHGIIRKLRRWGLVESKMKDPSRAANSRGNYLLHRLKPGAKLPVS